VLFGWSGKILRVDLSKMESWTEDTEPYTQTFIGGRGINVKTLYDEVGPNVGPYDPANRLCVGPGVLTGTLAPISGRVKLTSVSPNGLIASSGIGGFIGAEIKRAGYDNLVIQGESDEPVYLHVHDDCVEFKDATHVWGRDTWESEQGIKDEVGHAAQVMCIGPGGENLVTFGSIVTGMGSAAGRSGLGAIMGSKRLKAIVVRGTGQIRIAKVEEFVSACERAHKWFREVPAMKRQATEGGGDEQTLGFCHEHGQLPLGNWEGEDASWDEVGRFDGAEEFWNRYAIHQYGCFGCPVNHYHLFDVPGIGIGGCKCNGWLAFAGNVWNNDRKVMFHASHLCNRYGLDNTSTGAVVSFLMELYHKGIITDKDTDGIPMRRGDADAIISTVHKIGKQEGFGRLFKDGILNAAGKIGKGAEECTMVVKGAEIEPYEIRAFKSQALVAALAAGTVAEGLSVEFAYLGDPEAVGKWVEDRYGSKELVHPASYEKKPLIVWDYENRGAATDMLGICHWIVPWKVPSLGIPVELFSLATGRQTSEADLLHAAQATKTLERAFNVARGIRRSDDTLPRRLFEMPVPGGRFEGERLDRQAFYKMLDEYYALRGWDADGIPTEEAFKKYGLASEWQVFKKAMLKKKPARESATDE
jgi:aldehyde:ferredoxin oxidoreductase